MDTIFDQNADIEALVQNKRPSKNSIHNGYRPAFKIKEDYLTSGEIRFKTITELKYGEEALAEIRFITPEYYGACLYEGQILVFSEGSIVHGHAKIMKIHNKSLEKVI